ncbi:hypothetical protein CL616_01650 [archaeon]|nr:hypothetical protein [archaeon]|tara:strand:- start:649 stop:1605 length:957 start_codon:yes stop_codon:yes gene_type:complete
MRVAFQTGADVTEESSREHELNNPNYTVNPLLQGLFRRGIDRFFHYSTHSLENGQGISSAGYWVTLSNLDRTGRFHMDYSQAVENLEGFDIIFVRGDDVDQTTEERVQLIDSLENVILINGGKATLVTRDKGEIPHRFVGDEDLIPRTINVSSSQDLIKAWEEIPGPYIVLKGRYGFGGKEVERFERTREGHNQAKTYLSKVGMVVAQEFLPEISNGDIRVVLLEEEIIAAYRRMPNGSWTTNRMGGGRGVAVKLDQTLQERVIRCAQKFPEVIFQGLDITYERGRFIETNAFPASLGGLNSIYGIRTEETILDRLIK